MRFLVLTCVMLWTVCAAAAETSYPPCMAQRQIPVHFRDASSKDQLKVLVQGAPCYEARLVIEIKTGEGVLLYQYRAPFKRHTATGWYDPSLPEDATGLVEEIAKDGVSRNTVSLPSWLPSSEYYEKYYENIRVSRTRYNSLRKEKRPIFTHPTGYETWRAVVFDPVSGKGVVILEGGV